MARITTEEVERLLKKKKTVKWIAQKYKITRQAVYLHIDKIKQKQNKQIAKKKRDKPAKNYNALIDWHTYNEGLVKRGEFLLDLKVVKNWEKELELMNKGKIGAQFVYPESYIIFLLQLKNVFKIDYRTTEGLGRKLINLIPKADKSCDYSTLQRRLAKMEIKLQVYQRDTEKQDLAIDSSGLKRTNRGEYRISKYRGKRKQYVKLHIGVNIKNSEVVASEVTDESVSDNKEMGRLIEEAERNGNKVSSLLGDRGYDSQDNYGALYRQGIKSGIKPRATLTLEKIEEEIKIVWKQIERAQKFQKDASRLYDRLLRLKEMKSYFREPEEWKKGKNYGGRWKSEIRFSVFKRSFGEYVYSKNIKNIENEIILKVNLMNYFNSEIRSAFSFNDTS